MRQLVFLLLLTITTQIHASPPEYNELRIGTRLSLDPAIKTVKQAFEWILRPTSYKLVTQYPAPMQALEISKSPISPLSQEVQGQVIPVEEALLLIIGGDNRLVVDRENRLVSFEPMPKTGEL